MLVTCPVCFARYALEAALNDEAARQAMGRLAGCGGPTLRRVVAYVGLFRPEKHALAWGRAGRLIGEVVDIIEAGEIRRRGRPWALTRAQFDEALDVVVERREGGRLALPLKNHSYLLEVAAGIADKAEAAAERETEDKRRHRGEGAKRAGATTAVTEAQRFEALLAEAERLGVDRARDGRVRPLPDLHEAVRQARLQEAAK